MCELTNDSSLGVWRRGCKETVAKTAFQTEGEYSATVSIKHVNVF